MSPFQFRLLDVLLIISGSIDRLLNIDRLLDTDLFVYLKALSSCLGSLGPLFLNQDRASSSKLDVFIRIGEDMMGDCRGRGWMWPFGPSQRFSPKLSVCVAEFCLAVLLRPGKVRVQRA
jgi:hypothetical protein